MHVEELFQNLLRRGSLELVKNYFLDRYFVVVKLAEKLKKWEVGARFFVERWAFTLWTLPLPYIACF